MVQCRYALAGYIRALGGKYVKVCLLLKMALQSLIFLRSCGIILLLLVPVLGRAAEEKTTVPDLRALRIGFHFYKAGKIYDEAYQGISDGLLLANIKFEPYVYCADRDDGKTRINLTTLDSLDLDVIISFSSAGTQIAYNMPLKTPLLASVINHPISLGIGSVYDGNHPQISGTSYYVQAEHQLKLYLDLFPEVKKVGMIYDKNNPAGYLAEEPMMRSACEARDMVFVAVGATGRNDVAAAAKELVLQQAALVIIPTNMQIYNNLGLILEVTNRKKIPVVSMNKQGVEAGALAALFADTYKTGRQMASIILQLVDKKRSPADIPFYYSATPDLIINLRSAAALGYEFPPNILGQASIVLN